MGLFNLFSKKNSPSVKNLTWISLESKQKGCLKLLQEYPDAVLISWFPQTQENFRDFLLKHKREGVEPKLVRTVLSSSLSGKTVIFLEHYPLYSKEIEWLDTITPSATIFLNALDEPIFKRFGGDNLIQIMQKMGLAEDESIEHNLINSSIVNMQQKIEKKVSFEHTASSQVDWFRVNLPEEK